MKELQLNPNDKNVWYSLDILVADADPIFNNRVGHGLRKTGHCYRHTETAEPTLEMVKGESIDVLLIGDNVATIDNLHLISEIRELQPKLPIILLMSVPCKDMAVGFMRAGGDDVVGKNVVPDVLNMHLNLAYARYLHPHAAPRIVISWDND